MPAAAACDLAVARVFDVAACKAAEHFCDAIQILEGRDHAPEAPSSKDRRFVAFRYGGCVAHAVFDHGCGAFLLRFAFAFEIEGWGVDAIARTTLPWAAGEEIAAVGVAFGADNLGTYHSAVAVFGFDVRSV